MWNPALPGMPSAYFSEYTGNTHKFYGNVGLNLSNKLIQGHELTALPNTGELKIWDTISKTFDSLNLKDDDGVAPFVGFVGRPRAVATDPFDAFICTWAFDTITPQVFCFKNSCEYTTHSGTSPVCHACSTDIAFTVVNCQSSPKVRFFTYRIEVDSSLTDTELKYHGLMILQNFNLPTTAQLTLAWF